MSLAVFIHPQDRDIDKLVSMSNSYMRTYNSIDVDRICLYAVSKTASPDEFIKTLPSFQPLYGIWLPVFSPHPSNLQLFIKLFEKHKEKE